MGLETDVRTALLAMSAVTDLVSTRIRTDRLAEGDTLPAIILEVDSEDPENDLRGKGGLTYADLVVRCRAANGAAARALAEAVKLNGTDPGTGLAGYGTIASAFQAVLMSSSRAYIPDDDGSDMREREVAMDFRCSFQETI